MGCGCDARRESLEFFTPAMRGFIQPPAKESCDINGMPRNEARPPLTPRNAAGAHEQTLGQHYDMIETRLFKDMSVFSESCLPLPSKRRDEEFYTFPRYSRRPRRKYLK